MINPRQRDDLTMGGLLYQAIQTRLVRAASAEQLNRAMLAPLTG